MKLTGGDVSGKGANYAGARYSWVHSVAWNQQHACAAVATDRGFAVYDMPTSTQSLSELTRRDLGHEVRLVALLNRSNYVALVGGGADPLDSPNKVLLWDEALCKVAAEIEFRMPVMAVKFRHGHLVVATELAVYVYEFPAEPIKLLHRIETKQNQGGLLAVSTCAQNAVVATLSGQSSIAGKVQ